LALCVKNSVIATGSIGERIEIDRYIFFSFLTSGFIFPLGLAWCWNDGWLQNMGFIDYGGVAIVHVMGGLSGLIGTYLIGPRIGLFHLDKELNYIHSDEPLIEQLEKEKEMEQEYGEANPDYITEDEDFKQLSPDLQGLSESVAAAGLKLEDIKNKFMAKPLSNKGMNDNFKLI